MKLIRVLACFVSLASGAATAGPFRDPIPPEFQGVYARSAAGCGEKEDLASLRVTADQLAYYEADEFLILGIAFLGSPGAGPAVPMFNGRFTARQETNLLGEMNLRLVLEKPNVLVRYSLKEDGEPDKSHPDRWIRCPAGKAE